MQDYELSAEKHQAILCKSNSGQNHGALSMDKKWNSLHLDTISLVREVWRLGLGAD